MKEKSDQREKLMKEKNSEQMMKKSLKKKKRMKIFGPIFLWGEGEKRKGFLF